MLNIAIIPSIHNQLIAIGKKDRIANSILENENHKKRNTMPPQAKPINEKFGNSFGFRARSKQTPNKEFLYIVEDLQTIQNTSAEEGANQSNDVLENRLEKAYAAFGERVGEDGEMTDIEKVLIEETKFQVVNEVKEKIQEL